MANSPDNATELEGNLEEESDVIELTEEVRQRVAPKDDDVDSLALEMPEFRVPDEGEEADVDPRETQRLKRVTPDEKRKHPEAEPQSDETDDVDNDSDNEPTYDREELVATIQMEAIDRDAIERQLKSERVVDSSLLSDHRFAPDVLVRPPKLRVENWTQGLPEGTKLPAEVETEVGEEELEPLEDLEVVEEDLPDEDAIDTGRIEAPVDPDPELLLDDDVQDADEARPKPPPRPHESDGDAPIVKSKVVQGQPKPVKQEAQKPRRKRAPSPATQPSPGKNRKRKPTHPKRKNWFEDVFSEEFFRTLPEGLEDLTQREVDFIEDYIGFEPGARVLDLACGFGRHSVELADRGYEVAALDLSMPMLQRGLNEAQRRSLSIKFIHGDMRKLTFESVFDGCFLWQTSYGYFDDRTNFQVLQGIFRSLKPGGRFIIDVLNRDYAVAELPTRTWWEGHECVFLEEVEFDHHTSVVHTKRSFIYEDGSPPVEHNSFVRLYSLHELNQLLMLAGFDVIDVTGETYHPGRHLGASSSRVIVLAERPIPDKKRSK